MHRLKVHVAYASDDTLYGTIPGTKFNFRAAHSLDEVMRDILRMIAAGDG